MLIAVILTSVALLKPSSAVRTGISSQDYFNGLSSVLADAGLSNFHQALNVSNSTTGGQALLNDFYTDNHLTLFAPVDSAWVQSGLAPPPPSDDLNSLLAYHIVTGTLNSTSDIAASRHHTIALTKLRNPTILLPGNQNQVIVLETSPNGLNSGNGSVLVRGDTWNATSVGLQLVYENLLITPIDRILAVPSRLLETMSRSGLALAANMGATEYVNYTNRLGLKDLFESCVGCTFLVPVNAAFASISSRIQSLNEFQARAVLQNHIVNGTVAYSSTLPDLGRKSFITSAGEPLNFFANSSGSYFVGGEFQAKVIRSDIAVANGVVHLIDTVLYNPYSDPATAASAVSQASISATANVTGTIGVAPITTTSSPATTASQGNGNRLEWSGSCIAILELGLLAFVLL